MLNKFLKQLMPFDQVETTGEKLHFKFLELYLISHVIWSVWYWVEFIPRISDIVLPLGLANYIDISFMFDHSWSAINASIISILSILAFTRRTPKWTYFVILFLMHIQYISRFSLGEISHASNMTGMTLLVFALGMVIFQNSTDRRRFIFGGVLFFVGLSYVSAGISKLVGTGPFWIDGQHLWLWMGEKSIDILSREGVYQTNFLQQLAWDHRWIATLILFSGISIELGGCLLWFKKYRTLITILIIGMHVGIIYTMNIRFDASIVQMSIIGLPWAIWLDQLHNSNRLIKRQLNIGNNIVDKLESNRHTDQSVTN